MRKWLLTAAALGCSVAGLSAISTTPASAGPVCLTDKETTGNYQSCEYFSFRACRAAQNGVGGSCVHNPYWNEQYSYGGPAYGFGSSYNHYDGPMYGPAY
ncbi:DUF3551 domain-containing protein [Afipia sp. TerB]